MLRPYVCVHRLGKITRFQVYFSFGGLSKAREVLALERNMITKIERNRILIFLGFAYGIAWLTGLVIYLTGGLANSPRISPNLSLAGVLVPTAYMWAPALANLITRLTTREGWTKTGLRLYFRQGWPYWLAAWLLPAAATIFGAVIFFVIFPQYYAGLKVVTNQLQAAGRPATGNLWGFVVTQVAVGILIAPIVNGIFTFGEEFGWRAYLLPKLLPLGKWKAMILQGLIWGAWHWPVIVMGGEYGFNYPGFPWLGMLLFLLFTFSAGVLLAWVTLRGRSVWPALIGHGAINGIAALSVLFIQGKPSPLLGPTPVGLIGMSGYLLLALGLLFISKALTPAKPTDLPLLQAEEMANEQTGD